MIVRVHIENDAALPGAAENVTITAGDISIPGTIVSYWRDCEHQWGESIWMDGITWIEKCDLCRETQLVRRPRLRLIAPAA